MTQTVAVATDRDDVAVVQQAIYQRRRHDFISEDLAPLLEAFVAREHRRGRLVAPRHELEEEHRAGARHRQIPDLVDHQQGRVRQHLEALSQMPGRLRCPPSRRRSNLQ